MLQDPILFPTADELIGLRSRVGGLISASYVFPAADFTAAQNFAIQIATGQTLGYRPDNLLPFVEFVGRVEDVSFNDGLGRASILFPATLFGYDIAGLLTVLFGKISFAPGICLEAIQGDPKYFERMKGPRFGLVGIRALAKRADDKRPLLMAILKPGIGASDVPLAEQFSELADAGVDLIKDDETRIDKNFEESLHRLDLVNRHRRGRGIYVMHLTGPAFDLKRRAIKLQQEGAQAFLFCPMTYGLAILQALCDDPEIIVPIFAHPAFTGVMMENAPSIAPSVLLGTLMRWCGADAVLYPSPYGKIALPKQDALAIHRELTKMPGDSKIVASIPSAGIVPSFVRNLAEDFDSQIVVNAGTGMGGQGAIADGVGKFKLEINKYFK